MLSYSATTVEFVSVSKSDQSFDLGSAVRENVVVKH